MEENQKPQNTIKIGVTITESDVFETDDLPEDDQQLVSDYISTSLAKETHRSDCIDSSRLDATEAFKAFADKSLDSERVDFSDSIAIGRVGYPMTKAGGVRKETLEEKYNRLEKAVKDLAQEIDIVKANKGDHGDGDEELLSATSMMQKLDFLQRELSSVGMKEELVENDPQKFYHRKLLNDLDLFISSSSSSSPAPTATSSSPAADGDVIRYQMLCSPGETLYADDAVVEDLEQRIERCENVVGFEADKSGSLTGETPSKTLMGALSMVVAKFALLDLTQLTHFESSLLAIQQKQIAASSKSEASDIADKVDKVAGLYELLKKWDSMANAIPHILDRLNISPIYEAVKKANPTMEKLADVSERLKTTVEEHQSATQFSCTLAHVDSSQKQMIDTLSTHTEHLKQIQALLGPQMGLFEANCKALEELAS